MAEDNKIPKQDLLVKILNMTTSDNDGVALVALRKANALLAEAGWSWEKLIAGKIVVVGDPFGSLATPPSTKSDFGFPRSPPRRQTTPDPDWGKPNPAHFGGSAPPPPPRQAAPRAQTKSSVIGTKGNNYGGHCYCCGDHVPSQSGYIFNPNTINSRAPDKWHIICAPCNRGGIIVQSSAAKRRSATDSAYAHQAPDVNKL